MKRVLILLLLFSLSCSSFSLYLWQKTDNWLSVSSFRTFLDLCLIDNQIIKSLDELKDIKTLIVPLASDLSPLEIQDISNYLNKGGSLIVFPIKESSELESNFFNSFPQFLKNPVTEGNLSYSLLNGSGFFIHDDVVISIRDDSTKEFLVNLIKESEPESLHSTKNFANMRIQEIEEIVQKTLKGKLPTEKNNNTLKYEKELLDVLERTVISGENFHVWKLTALKTEAEEKAELYKASFFDSLPIETRGIWISAKAIPQTRNGIASMVKEIADANFNVIFPEVFSHGYTIFPSSVAASYGIEKQHPKFINWDPLLVLCEEAKKNNIEIHAWFSVYYVGFGDYGPILSKYPHWAAVNIDGSLGYSRDGNFLYYASPLSGEFREYVTELMVEALKYDLDGIHLDYLRYSGMDVAETDYNQDAIAGFVERYNLLPNERRTKAPRLWIYYRSNGVDELVSLVSQKLRAIKPGIFVSAAVAPDGPPTDYSRNYLQNWPLWLSKGYVDFVIPMTYSPNPLNVKGWFASAVKKAPFFAPVYAGVSGFNLLDRSGLSKQVTELGRSSGSLGTFFFAYDHFDTQGLRVLKAGVFSNKAKLTHHYNPEDYSLLLDYCHSRAKSKQIEQIAALPLINLYTSLPKEGNAFQNYNTYKETIGLLKSTKNLLQATKTPNDESNSVNNQDFAFLLNDLELLESWLYSAGRYGLVSKESIDERLREVSEQLSVLLPNTVYSLTPSYLYEKNIWGSSFYHEVNTLYNIFLYDRTNHSNLKAKSLLEELILLASLSWE